MDTLLRYSPSKFIACSDQNIATPPVSFANRQPGIPALQLSSRIPSLVTDVSSDCSSVDSRGADGGSRACSRVELQVYSEGIVVAVRGEMSFNCIDCVSDDPLPLFLRSCGALASFGVRLVRLFELIHPVPAGNCSNFITLASSSHSDSLPIIFFKVKVFSARIRTRQVYVRWDIPSTSIAFFSGGVMLLVIIFRVDGMTKIRTEVIRACLSP